MNGLCRFVLASSVTLAAWLTGCAASTPTTDALVVVTRGAADHDFRLHLLDWRNDGLIERWAAPVGPANVAPRPLAIASGGRAVIVEMRDRGDGRAHLQRLGPPAEEVTASPSTAPAVARGGSLDEVHFDTVLDADGPTLLLSQQVNRRPRPVLRVSRGEIHEVNPPWSHPIIVDAASGVVRNDLSQSMQFIARLTPLEWLVLVDGPTPALQLLDARRATATRVSEWDRQRHIAGAVVTPGGRRALLAVQRVGERWNLFDLYRWDRDTNRVELLVPAVFSANRPNANVGPALPMYAINDRHIAFVLTEVSEWRGRTPVEGQYHTAVLDIQAGTVLVRIRNQQRGLRNEVPPPYLPSGRLAALRIDRTNTIAPRSASGDEVGEGADERWPAFLTFRDGNLVDGAGQVYDLRSLGPYAYSSDGNVMAVRERVPEHDRCLVFEGRRRLPPIELHGIERLVWLRQPLDAK